MEINMMLALALLVAAPAAASEWAPVGLVDDGGTTVYFVDRTRIEAGPEGRAAWVYAVSNDVALKLHVQFDCDGGRYRHLEASLGSAAAAWAPVKPQSPLDNARRYVCAGGKIDLGFGDLAVPFETPEAFAHAFISRRAQARRN
jgi:hypothetical protein